MPGDDRIPSRIAGGFSAPPFSKADGRVYCRNLHLLNSRYPYRPMTSSLADSTLMGSLSPLIRFRTSTFIYERRSSGPLWRYKIIFGI